MVKAVALMLSASSRYPSRVRWMLSLCMCCLSDDVLLKGMSCALFMLWMMSRTLCVVIPVLLSVLMIVCCCLVCSASACCGWRGVWMLLLRVLLSQQEPKTNLGMGGMKIFALFFRVTSRLPRDLTCSLRISSGVYTESPRRCQPPSPSNLTAKDNVSSSWLIWTIALRWCFSEMLLYITVPFCSYYSI